MSQAKVDRYKQEKKNRAKELKKKKIKKAVAYVVCACLAGAAIGVPLGKKLYKVSKARQEAKATIDANNFDYWSQLNWQQKYQGITGLDDHTATDTDADTNDNDTSSNSDASSEATADTTTADTTTEDIATEDITTEDVSTEDISSASDAE